MHSEGRHSIPVQEGKMLFAASHSPPFSLLKKHTSTNDLWLAVTELHFLTPFFAAVRIAAPLVFHFCLRLYK